jgi:hypothetical protein
MEELLKGLSDLESMINLAMKEIIIKYDTDDLKILISLVSDANDANSLVVIMHKLRDSPMCLVDYLYEQFIINQAFDIYKFLIYMDTHDKQCIISEIIKKSVTENTFDDIIQKIDNNILCEIVDKFDENILHRLINNKIDKKLFETIMYSSDKLFVEYFDQFIQTYNIPDASYLYDKIKHFSSQSIKVLLSHNIIPPVSYINYVIDNKNYECLELFFEYQIDIRNIYKQNTERNRYTTILESFNIDLIDYVSNQKGIKFYL